MTKKTLQAKAFKALKEAVHEVIEQHKLSGRPLSVWRHGKVVKISANEALRKKNVTHSIINKTKNNTKLGIE